MGVGRDGTRWRTRRGRDKRVKEREETEGGRKGRNGGG